MLLTLELLHWEKQPDDAVGLAAYDAKFRSLRLHRDGMLLQYQPLKKLLAKGRQIGDGTNDGGCRLRITQIARVDVLNNRNSDTNRPLKKNEVCCCRKKKRLPEKNDFSGWLKRSGITDWI